MAKHRRKAQAHKAKALPLPVTRSVSDKVPKTRNVVVKMSKKEITAMRRSCLDIVHDKTEKGGIVIRVPREAKNVRVSSSKAEVSVSFTHKGKKFRRVDTPIKSFDWTKTESRDFLRQGIRKGEKMLKVRIGVRGYDSKHSHAAGTFGHYVTNGFMPKITRLRGKKNKAKKDVCNFFSVRRTYVSKTNTGKTQASRKRSQRSGKRRR